MVVFKEFAMTIFDLTVMLELFGDGRHFKNDPCWGSDDRVNA